MSTELIDLTNADAISALVPFEENAVVKKGDLLATLNNSLTKEAKLYLEKINSKNYRLKKNCNFKEIKNIKTKIN